MRKNLKKDLTIVFRGKRYSSTAWCCRASRILKRRHTALNIKYRDTLFTMLFQQPEKAVELYNALYGRHLPSDTPVEIMTLDDALFVKRKNDVAFLIDGHFLIFVEHQSTLNENMPLRLLLYVAQEYEKILGCRMVKGKPVSNPNLYKKEAIKIPRPEFFVLYNGQDDLTGLTAEGKTEKVREKTMRLSDAFSDHSGDHQNSLELCVKVIDIRYPSRHPALGTEESMTSLGEYSYFVEEKENAIRNGMDNRTATLTAVEHCIKKGILKDFLLQHETEVVSMMVGVYDEEMEKRVLCEEAEAHGIQLGKVSGIISFALDLNYSNEEILSVLQKKLHITESQADRYLEQYYADRL
jgi:hypothetical protein